MDNIVEFPRKRLPHTAIPLVEDMSRDDRIASQSQNAFAALMVTLEEDGIATDRLVTSMQLEAIRNLIWGLVEHSNGKETNRVKLLDEIVVALALRNLKS